MFLRSDLKSCLFLHDAQKLVSCLKVHLVASNHEFSMTNFFLSPSQQKRIIEILRLEVCKYSKTLDQTEDLKDIQEAENLLKKNLIKNLV